MNRDDVVGNEWSLTELVCRFRVLAREYRSYRRRDAGNEWVGRFALLSGWDDLGEWRVRLLFVPPFIECCDDVRCRIGDEAFFDALMGLRRPVPPACAVPQPESSDHKVAKSLPGGDGPIVGPIEIRMHQVAFSGVVTFGMGGERCSDLRLNGAEWVATDRTPRSDPGDRRM